MHNMQRKRSVLPKTFIPPKKMKSATSTETSSSSEQINTKIANVEEKSQQFIETQCPELGQSSAGYSSTQQIENKPQLNQPGKENWMLLDDVAEIDPASISQILGLPHTSESLYVLDVPVETISVLTQDSGLRELKKNDDIDIFTYDEESVDESQTTISIQQLQVPQAVIEEEVTSTCSDAPATPSSTRNICYDEQPQTPASIAYIERGDSTSVRDDVEKHSHCTNINCCSCKNCDVLLKKVNLLQNLVDKQGTLLQQQKDEVIQLQRGMVKQANMMKRLCNFLMPSEESIPRDFPFKFPLKENNKIVELEEFLSNKNNQDKFKRWILQMKGKKDLKVFLPMFLHEDVQCLYNVRGVRGKLKFTTYENICTCLFDCFTRTNFGYMEFHKELDEGLRAAKVKINKAPSKKRKKNTGEQ